MSNYSTESEFYREIGIRNAPVEIVEFKWQHATNPLHDLDPFPTSSPSAAFLPEDIIFLKERKKKVLGKGRHNWNEFEHYKFVRTSPVMSSVVHPTGNYVATGLAASFPWNKGIHEDPLFGWRGHGTASEPLSGLLPYYDPVGDQAEDSFVNPPADLDLLIQRALSSVLPGIKAELNAPVSIFELGDFKSSIVNSLSNWRLLRDGKLFKKLKNYFTKQPLSKAVHASADSYLSAEFNYLPLLSDIRGTYTALSRVEKAIRRLLDNAQKYRVRHYTLLLNEEQERTDVYGPYTLGPLQGVYPAVDGECWTYRQLYPGTSVFHVQIGFEYHLTQYQLEHARVLAMLDAFGAGGFSLRSIWQVIPWSFVVDWVLSVGKYLDQFSEPAMKPVINIHRTLWSIKRSRELVLQKTVGKNPFNFSYTEHGSCGVIRETAYRRSSFNVTSSSINSSGLTSSEVSLGVALVITGSKRRRR